MTLNQQSTTARRLLVESDERALQSSLTGARGAWFGAISGTAEAFMYETVLTEGARGRSLPLPLRVQVRRAAGYTAIIEPISAIHGIGDTITEATQDFYEALIEYRDTLARQSDLSPELTALLARLTSLGA